MRKVLFIFLFFSAIFSGYADGYNGYFVAGVEYNYFNPSHIAGSAGAGVALYRSGSSKVFWDIRFGGGKVKHEWEEINIFSKDQEIATQERSGGLFIMNTGVLWQYEFNRIFGLRFGMSVPILISSVFDTSLPLGFGVNGRAGISLFTTSKILFILEINPGFIAAKSIKKKKKNGVSFVMPVILLVG
jgi:hypothetical protein